MQVFSFFLPVLDYGDVLFMNAPAPYLKKSDTVHRCASRVITGYRNRLHLCMLLLNVRLCISTDLPIGPLVGLYKSLLGLVPSYLCVYMCKSHIQYSLALTMSYK